MKSLLDVPMVKLTTACLITVLALGGCAKKKTTDESSEDPGGGGGTPTLTLSGTYKTNCYQVAGATVAGGTYYRTIIYYGHGGDPAGFEYDKSYYSDSSCNTLVYNSALSGTFAVGSVSTSQSDAFNITYTVANSYVIAWGATASSALSSGCTTNVNWATSGSNKLGTVYGNFNCAGVTVGAPATFYNIVSLSGSTVSTGTTSGDNPGETTTNAVATSTSMSFPN